MKPLSFYSSKHNTTKRTHNKALILRKMRPSTCYFLLIFNFRDFAPLQFFNSRLHNLGQTAADLDHLINHLAEDMIIYPQVGKKSQRLFECIAVGSLRKMNLSQY